MANRIFWNINGQGVRDINELLAHFEAANPRAVLVMNNFDLAVQLHQLSGGKTVIIHRDYTTDEGFEWVKRPISHMLQEWDKQGHPEIYRYSTNEPSWRDEDGMRLQDFVANQVQLGDEAYQRGFSVVLGNFSVGKFQPEDVNAGVYDPYLEMLGRHKEWHFGGTHEYQTAHIFAEHLRNDPHGFPKNLIHRDVLKKDNWMSAEEIKLQSRWFMGRYDWLLERAEKIGAPLHRVIITEWGWDTTINNQTDSLDEVKNYFQQFKHNNLDIPRGFRGLKRYASHLYPGWSFDEFLYEQLAAADERIYDENYHSLLLFTWSSSPDWVTFDGSTNEDGIPDLRRKIEAHISPEFDEVPETPAPPTVEHVMPAPDDAGWKRYEIAANSSAGTRVRSYPDTSTKNNILTAIFDTMTLYLLNLEHVIEIEGAIWYPIGITTDKGVVYGWIHSGFVVPGNPQEYVEPEPEEFDKSRMIQRWQEIYSAATLVQKAAADALEELGALPNPQYLSINKSD